MSNAKKRQTKLFVGLFILLLLFGMLNISFNGVQTHVNLTRASKDLSSYYPYPIKVPQGKWHLFFEHQFKNLDTISLETYHTFETSLDHWNIPKPIFKPNEHGYIEQILLINAKKSKLELYYTKYGENNVYLREFTEKDNQWTDLGIFLSAKDFAAALGFHEEDYEDVIPIIDRFYPISDEIFLIIWHFKTTGAVTYTSAYELQNTYLGSIYSPNKTFSINKIVKMGDDVQYFNVDLNLDKIGLVQVGAPHYALT